MGGLTVGLGSLSPPNFTKCMTKEQFEHDGIKVKISENYIKKKHQKLIKIRLKQSKFFN